MLNEIRHFWARMFGTRAPGAPTAPSEKSETARYLDRNGRVRWRCAYALPPFRPQGGSIPGSWDTRLDGRTPLDDMGDVVNAHRPRMQAEAKRRNRRFRLQNSNLRIDRHLAAVS